MNRSTSAAGDIARIDSEPPPPGEYDAPTKVGPMSAGAVAKLMLEAEPETAKGPLSGVRRSSPSLRGAEDAGAEDAGPPSLVSDEDTLEPTRVNPGASASLASKEVVEAKTTGANLVDAIVDAMVTLDDADLEPEVLPSKPPPLPARATNSVGPARLQPRPAAFPEWIPQASANPMADDGKRKRAVWIAVAGGVATVILLLWWLCS